MCGISLINETKQEQIKLIQHRGPDETKIHKCKISENATYVMGFHRLSINDLSENGSQPFVENDNAFVCNGEIYNHEILKQKYNMNDVKGGSDCEILYKMLVNRQEYRLTVNEICNELDGVFSFIHVEKDHLIVARDPIGIRPLYSGMNKDTGELEFASEIKVISHCVNVKHFPPGHYWTRSEGFVNYTPLSYPLFPKNDYKSTDINILLTDAVKKRMMSDRPVGFFLSGGLDSSIIASIGSKLMYPKKIKTFSIGVKGYESPDLKAAQKVAEYLNTEHHVYEFELEEAYEMIKKTIYHLESYDCTTVRASVPMYLLSKYVSENSDCKVILSGEGADELFGGYLYLHDAPTDDDFQKETIRLVKNVHQFDALRADRCTAANGLELRVPFFDKKFVEYVTNIKPIFKLNKTNWMEKTILRRAFEGFLPDEILWRQKNGMSDAVGYSWVDYVRNTVCHTVGIENVDKNKPKTNEEMYYRKIYLDMFDNHDAMDAGIWRPLWTNEIDPSARKLTVFKS